MKYIISLILGLLTGVALFAAVVVYNPVIGKQSLSPLAVTDSQTVTLSYSAVASDAIVFSNNGDTRIHPHPEKVLQLWESSIRQTSAMATVLRNARNETAGIGIKVESASEKTRLLAGEALVDSVWYVYLPGRGSFFIEQTENYWVYLREIVFPAYRSSAKTWRGTWLGNVSSGPGALGTSKITGGSGDFANMEMLGVESLSVRVWRVDDGPVASDGQLIIELPAKMPDDEFYEEEFPEEESAAQD